MAREGYIRIGEGEGGLSASDWGAPLSGCTALLSLHNECETCGYNFPTGEISELLKRHRLLRKPFSTDAGENLIGFLNSLLGDDIDISREHYDSGMPGASGVYYKVYLRADRMMAVEAMLQVVETYLLEWREESGLSAKLKSREDEALVARAGAEQMRRVAESQSQQRQEDATRKWEEELLQQVLQHIREASPQAFARLHFMVFKGRVFFLEKQGWWHSIKGDPTNVLKRLSECNVPVTKVGISLSTKGWIPHFARTRLEEKGLGWFDKTIQLRTGSAEADILVQEARKTLEQ